MRDVQLLLWSCFILRVRKNDAYTHTFPHLFLWCGVLFYSSGEKEKNRLFLLHTWRERQVALMLAVICQGQKPIVSASLLRSTSKHTCAPLRKAGKFNRMVDQSCVSFETDLAVGFVKWIFCSRVVGKLRKLAVPVRVQLSPPTPWKTKLECYL